MRGRVENNLNTLIRKTERRVEGEKRESEKKKGSRMLVKSV